MLASIHTVATGRIVYGRHAGKTPTFAERKEKLRQSVVVGFGGRAPSPSGSPAHGKSLSPAVGGHICLSALPLHYR